MTSTALADIEHRITIEAGIDRAWEVLTDPSHVAAWLGCLQYRAEVGHLFYMQPDPAKRAAGDIDGATHCEILEITPPTRLARHSSPGGSAWRPSKPADVRTVPLRGRLAFSWFLPGTPRTTVTLTLEARDGGATQVTLVHTGWDQFEADDVRAIHEQLTLGWRDFVLPGLARAAVDGA